jgi:hypothetical protein
VVKSLDLRVILKENLDFAQVFFPGGLVESQHHFVNLILAVDVVVDFLEVFVHFVRLADLNYIVQVNVLLGICHNSFNLQLVAYLLFELVGHLIDILLIIDFEKLLRRLVSHFFVSGFRVGCCGQEVHRYGLSWACTWSTRWLRACLFVRTLALNFHLTVMFKRSWLPIFHEALESILALFIVDLLCPGLLFGLIHKIIVFVVIRLHFLRHIRLNIIEIYSSHCIIGVEIVNHQNLHNLRLVIIKPKLLHLLFRDQILLKSFFVVQFTFFNVISGCVGTLLGESS